jgi:flagellar basal body-associated protein FliL
MSATPLLLKVFPKRFAAITTDDEGEHSKHTNKEEEEQEEEDKKVMLNAYRLLLLLLLLFISLSRVSVVYPFFGDAKERKMGKKNCCFQEKEKKEHQQSISRHNFLRTNKKISLLSQQKALSFSLSLS